MAKQSWLCEVNDNSLCTTYRIMKVNFGYEKYLNTQDCQQRTILCKFRSGNHRLPINTGRYENIERKLRHCPLCDVNELTTSFNIYLTVNCSQMNDSCI